MPLPILPLPSSCISENDTNCTLIPLVSEHDHLGASLLPGDLIVKVTYLVPKAFQIILGASNDNSQGIMQVSLDN